MRLEDNNTLCNLQVTSDRGVCTVRTHTRAMSLRPGGAATSNKPTSAARLDAVLRAGQSVALVTKARDQAEEDDVGSGLTKALKNTSLVPTGACLPRGFDPDYCAYDRYYTVGVALVSAVLGALVDANMPQKLIAILGTQVNAVVSNMCYTPPNDAYSAYMGKNRPLHQIGDPADREVAWNGLTPLCRALTSALTDARMAEFSGSHYTAEARIRQEADFAHWDKCAAINSQQPWLNWLVGSSIGGCDNAQSLEGAYQAGNDAVAREKESNPALRFEILVRNIISLILLPGSMLGSFIVPGESSILYEKSNDDPSKNSDKLVQHLLPSTQRDMPLEERLRAVKSFEAQPNWLYVGAMAAWTLKHVSRYMNEHALMIASFFRTNARRLGAGQAPMLDLVAFARQCREDIADGANPPPPPPPVYEEFNQAAVAAERRREDARKRTEERDPLMDGIDYPETYASASGAAPLRA